MEVRRRRSCREATDGDPTGVSAEVSDVPLHPAEGGDLVQEAVVAGERLGARREEACLEEFLMDEEKNMSDLKLNVLNNKTIYVFELSQASVPHRARPACSWR